MRKPIQVLIIAAVLILLSLACTFSPPDMQEPTVIASGTALAPTPGAAATSTPVEETITPTAPEEIPSVVEATITAQGVNLRQGPGTLFATLRLLDLHTQVTVLGRARGDDWLLVELDQREGWVAVDFTSLDGAPELPHLPVVDTGSTQIVRGQVTDTFGGPVQGVVFALVQASGETVQRTEATTLKDGHFYAYLPSGTEGPWRVALIGVDCRSPIVDENCTFAGQFVPTWKDVTLPLTGTVVFQYVDP